MARIRTIKPELFKHEELFDLERESGLPLRVAFIGLFTCCDREGRFKWRPRALKLDILPYDECDFSRVLDALTTRDFVRKYVSDGEEYGVIPTFLKHQVINNKESGSVLPTPTKSSYISTTSTRAPRVPDACPTPLNLDQGEGKGREGKGREEEGKGTLVLASPPDIQIEQFEQVWDAYPKRPGASKADSMKAWKARIKAGATADEILDGTRRYAAFVIASRTEPQFIKQPATFFGAGDHFRADWTAPATTARQAPGATFDLAAAQRASTAEARRKLFGNKLEILDA